VPAVLRVLAITRQRSWFAGCQSLLYYRGDRATRRSPRTVGSVQMNAASSRKVHNALSSSKTLENNELNRPHPLSVRTRIALWRLWGLQ
jgi:hypothetical protein